MRVFRFGRSRTDGKEGDKLKRYNRITPRLDLWARLTRRKVIDYIGDKLLPSHAVSMQCYSVSLVCFKFEKIKSIILSEIALSISISLKCTSGRLSGVSPGFAHSFVYG